MLYPEVYLVPPIDLYSRFENAHYVKARSYAPASIKILHALFKLDEWKTFSNEPAAAIL